MRCCYSRLVGLTAGIFLGLTARADVLTEGLSNTPTAKGITSSGIYNPLAIYSEPGGFGVAFLIPPAPLSLPRGGGPSTSAFLTGLNSYNILEDYTFAAATSDLNQNSLVVNADQVAGGFPCPQGGGDCVGIFGRFGANPTAGFAVSYTGPAIQNAHWIQVISTSSPAAGQTSPYVDNNGTVLTPYYDDQFDASSTVFLDASNRPATTSQYWLGSLYYVSGANFGTRNNPATITVYNGLIWGWADLFVPGNFAAFFAAVNGDLNNVADLDGALGTDLASVLTQSELNTIDAEFNAAAVPEPSSLIFLGLCLLAAIYMSRAWRLSH
jgi:hypothetical protein